MGSVSAFGPLNNGLDYDVLIIGAGLSGIYTIHRMRELGLRALVLEAGSDVGGTWYWNRYPGARFDSESYSYIFSFSQEILDEWKWTEHFAPQPETLRYAGFLTEKLGVRGNIQFDTRVVSAHWQDASSSWRLTDDRGKAYTSRYLVTAMGILNAPTMPAIPGIDGAFKGASWHTARWPAEATAESLRGKRVGIVGTGATAIQTIQVIAKEVGSLTVFQRTPNWTAPLRNGPISDDEMAAIRKRYPEIFRLCSTSYACFVHQSEPRRTSDMTPAEREALWEHIYQQRGFAKVLSVPADVYTDAAANKLYSDFHARKIRARVHDPVTAEMLIPRNHGFGTRRVPLESGYLEVFNQPNVHLVDVRDNAIERITETGLRTADGVEHGAFDVLIFATGFDAVTGSFDQVDFRGRDGIALRDVWRQGIRTFLGLTVQNFPNMFMVMGPHQMFGNIPRSIEYAVDWIADILRFAAEHRPAPLRTIEATAAGMDAWTQHVQECGVGLLSNNVDSWMTGVNKNLKHKQVRSLTRYNGPAPGYRKRCDAVKARGYSDFVLKE